MADDGSVVSGSTSKSTTVTDLLLNVADDGTLRALANGDDVADGQSGLFTAVNEGTGVEAFSSNESLFAELVAVGVTEDDAGEGGTTVNRYNEISCKLDDRLASS